jgi:hypothetical protein
MREQHDLAIGKLNSTMVCIWIIHVDEPDMSHLVTELPGFLFENPQAKSSNPMLDLAIEHDLGARKKGHGHLGFSWGEPARRGIPKLSRD